MFNRFGFGGDGAADEIDAVWIGERNREGIAALTYLLDLAPEYPEGDAPDSNGEGDD